MATLESFLPQGNSGLGSFKIEGPLIPISNAPSNRNIAAFTAALSGEPESVEATYLQVSNDLDVYGQSSMGEALQERAKDFSYAQEREVLIGILSDPSIPDEVKQEAANQFLDRANQNFSENYTLRKIVAETSLTEPSGYETAEAEDVRVSFAGSLDEVDDYLLWQQSLINQEAAASNPSLTSSVIDFIDMVLPFAEPGQVSRIKRKVEDGNLLGALRDTVLFGSAKKDIREMVRELPPKDRRAFAQTLVDIVNSEATIALPGENDLARMDQIRSFLEDGYYEDWEVVADNIVGVLDVTLLGGIYKGARRMFRRPPPLEGDVTSRRLETTVQPSTLSQVYKNTNPKKARDAHEAAARDTSGEAAEALYGTSRTEAIANDLLPQTAVPGGSVRAKVSRADAVHKANITPSAEVMDIVRSEGGLHYWRQEKEAFRTRVFNDFHNAFGLTARAEMSQIGFDGTRANINMVYGPMDSGWANARDAIDLTAFNLRHYGVTEDQITLLMRQGDNYVPTKLEDVPEGATDFLTQVRTNLQMSSADVEKWEVADVLHNFFDRFPLFQGKSQGSFQRHLVDPQSMLHPNIVFGASVAVDKANHLEKVLLNELSRFTDIYTKLPSDRKQLLENIIKEANYNSRQPNYTELLSKGYSREEIQALRSWKEFWDTQWWLENSDLRRTLDHRGYRMFESPGTDTRLYARPVSRNRAPETARVYDEKSGEVVTYTPEMIQDLYGKGGTLAQMRQPLRVGDEAVDMIVSEERAGGSYLRRFNEDDHVLNYREGYYQVFYDAPRFIDKIEVDSRGNELYRHAVAVAGSTKDADLMVKRLQATDGGRYVSREGREKMRMDGDDYWSLQNAAGRSAQRARGERLESASSPNNSAIDHDFVLSPGEAAIAAIRSVSQRVRMRDFLEAGKSRFISQYGDMLPTDQFGRPRYPDRISQIVKRSGTQRDRDIADARTSYEYLWSLENQYLNAVDETYKASLRIMADLSSQVGFSKGERALHYLADSRGPMQLSRNMAFTMYLALNPLRQVLVQGHQSVQLFANFPKYASSRLAADTAMMMEMIALDWKAGKRGKHPTLAKMARRDVDEAASMVQQFDRSGLSASIDKHSLVRGSLTEFVEYSNYTGSVIGKALKPIEWSRKIGFDAGENVNMMTAWLTHYNARKESTGKTWKQLNQEDYDWIAAKARTYTYGMNRAGEMPYNQNMLGMQMQFMQVPHKALLQMITDRTLTRMERLRLAGFNAVMYGVPSASILYPFVERIAPEEGELREMVLQGLEAYTLNKLLSLTTGEETVLDYSGLAPADMTALFDMMAAVVTTDLGTILAESPSGSLFFGGNPRLTNLFKTVARWGNFVDDIEDPVTMQRVAKEVAGLSSGMSNFFKARYIMKAGQKISTSGVVTVEDAGVGEALGQMFGFNTREEANRYYISQEVYEATKEFNEDVRTYWRELNRHLTAEGVDRKSQEWVTRVLTDMQRAWEGSTRAQEIILQEMERSLADGDIALQQAIIRMAPEMDNEFIRRLARTMPNQELGNEILQTLEFLDSYQGIPDQYEDE